VSKKIINIQIFKQLLLDQYFEMNSIISVISLHHIYIYTLYASNICDNQADRSPELSLN